MWLEQQDHDKKQWFLGIVSWWWMWLAWEDKGSRAKNSRERDREREKWNKVGSSDREFEFTWTLFYRSITVIHKRCHCCVIYTNYEVSLFQTVILCIRTNDIFCMKNNDILKRKRCHCCACRVTLFKNYVVHTTCYCLKNT